MNYGNYEQKKSYNYKVARKKAKAATKTQKSRARQIRQKEIEEERMCAELIAEKEAKSKGLPLPQLKQRRKRSVSIHNLHSSIRACACMLVHYVY